MSALHSKADPYSPVPNRDVSDTCIEKMERNEIIEGGAVDTVRLVDVTTKNRVLTKMPETFQIFFELLRRAGEYQLKNEG